MKWKDTFTNAFFLGLAAVFVYFVFPLIGLHELATTDHLYHTWISMVAGNIFVRWCDYTGTTIE